MKKMLASLILYVLVIGSIHAALVTQSTTDQRPGGVWTGTIEGKDQYSNKSEQYVLCGYSLLSENWNATVANCNCGYGFHMGQIRWRCQPCLNNLDTKTSGFKAIFCHYNNWNDQIVKTVTSNSTNSGKWINTTMCSSNYYSIGIAPKFGTQYGLDLGLSGATLSCSTTNLANSEIITDNGVGRSVAMFKPKAGNFITSLQVKLEQGGSLTGLTSQYEGLPVITKVVLTYYPYVDHNSVPVVIDAQSVTNCANTIATQEVFYSKTYETSSTWKTIDGYSKGVKLNSMVIEPPSLPSNNSNSNEGGSPYKSSTQQFGFQKVVKTILSSGQKVTVLIPSKKQVNINTVIQEQKGNLPYTATITVCNLYNGEFIMEYTVEGVWEGVMTSSAKTTINDNDAVCRNTVVPPPTQPTNNTTKPPIKPPTPPNNNNRNIKK